MLSVVPAFSCVHGTFSGWVFRGQNGPFSPQAPSSGAMWPPQSPHLAEVGPVHTSQVGLLSMEDLSSIGEDKRGQNGGQWRTKGKNGGQWRKNGQNGG